MSRLTEEQKFIFKAKLIDFLEEYFYLYSEEEKYMINSYFLGRAFEDNKPIDIMDEIYQEIGVYDAVTDNIYSDFYNVMTSYLSINQRLLEVGCGILPSFAKMMVKKQRCGSLIVIDPNVRLERAYGFAMLRREFNQDFDITDIDLLYGIQTCGATLDMIKLANAKNKDLCLLPCACKHFPYDEAGKYKNATLEDWYAYLENLIESTLPEDREFIKETAPSINYPIYITRKLTNK
ncbi:MAG: hypothetical protein J1F35_01405 [Erysipelotrichales bacterium]|nr:hypothetical protein [Erysipelotrichales bacterium]